MQRCARVLALLASAAAAVPGAGRSAPSRRDGGPVLSIGGKTFRDLDRDGRLGRYEDWRLSPEARAADLVARMTLAEKAGMMMHGTLPGAGPGATAAIGRSGAGYDLAKAADMIGRRGVNSFITRLTLPPRELARQNNLIQGLAARTRLGIPATISTDPRNHFNYVLGAGEAAGGFSQWPDPLGFGALGDPATVRRFADIARREYRAVGIHEALSPQADLATEPRWSRMTGTFGSTAARVSPLVGAYIEGFQHGRDGVGRDGVLAVVKHWVGYGAEPEGFDAHNRYGRVARLSDRSFAEHVAAFRGAFAAGVAGVMPTYPIIAGVTLDGKPLEPVGAGFNRQLLTGLLRGRMSYDGIILSDWAITRDCGPECSAPTRPQTVADIAMPWGVENLTEAERFAKGIDAGLDQFGGVEQPDVIVAAVRSGRLRETRIDQSVRRILLVKIPPGAVRTAVRRRGAGSGDRRCRSLHRRRRRCAAAHPGAARKQGRPAAARRRAPRLGLWPVAPAHPRGGLRERRTAARRDVAILRMAAPSEMLHPDHFFGSRQHEGRLDFRDGDPGYDALKAAAASGKPVIVSVYLDRPAILSDVRDKASVLLANFGAGDDALLDVIAGRAAAQGRLPFELPSSMAAVERQNPAEQDDSAAPLYAVGAGRTR